MSETAADAPAPEPAPAGERAAGPPGLGGTSRLRRIVGAVGVDNLSLIFALILVMAIVVCLQPLFLTWQNLMNSLAQTIVIVGLLAIGETVVIVAGALDISVGSIASVASVISAMDRLGSASAGRLRAPMPTVQGRCRRAHRGIVTGMVLGVVNGLIVTELRVNPIIATLGTLAAFAGLAFLLAPDGKPVGVVTQPDFTWLATGRFPAELPIPPLGGATGRASRSCW